MASAAGYSGKPLSEKLGIKDTSSVRVLAAKGVTIPTDLGLSSTGRAPFDVVVAFVTAERDLVDALPAWVALIRPTGGLWIAWPKKAARKVVPSDITEDTIRVHALPLGVVDNKVCAVDEVWSGLRLVWRKERRPQTKRS